MFLRIIFKPFLGLLLGIFCLPMLQAMNQQQEEKDLALALQKSLESAKLDEQKRQQKKASLAAEEKKIESCDEELKRVFKLSLEGLAQPLQFFYQQEAEQNIADADLVKQGKLVKECDEKNTSFIFDQKLPNNLPIQQIPALYQGYPSLPTNLCGYYAAFFAQQCINHHNGPEHSLNNLVKKLNNRSTFDEFLKNAQATINADNLTGEQIQMIVDNEVIVDGVVGRQHQEYLAMEQAFTQGKRNFLIYILPNGHRNHWFTVLCLKKGMIIADSLATDHRADVSIVNLYHKLYDQPQKPTSKNLHTPRLCTWLSFSALAVLATVALYTVTQ